MAKRLRDRLISSLDEASTEMEDAQLLDRLRAFRERRMGGTASNQNQKLAAAKAGAALKGLKGLDSGSKAAMKLRTMWTGMPITKDTQDVVQSYAKIRSSEDTPSGNLALLYNFNKMLDPGSVVRPSEFEAAAKAGKLTDRLGPAGLIRRIVEGQTITKAQRAGFFKTAHEIYLKQMGVQKSLDQQFSNLAASQGISEQIPFSFSQEGLSTIPQWVVEELSKERTKKPTSKPSKERSKLGKRKSKSGEIVRAGGMTYRKQGNRYIPIEE